jgi:hypothetical protein
MAACLQRGTDDAGQAGAREDSWPSLPFVHSGHVKRRLLCSALVLYIHVQEQSHHLLFSPNSERSPMSMYKRHELFLIGILHGRDHVT